MDRQHLVACGLQALDPAVFILLAQFALSESQTAVGGSPRATLRFLNKGKIMNYVIVFATGAVAGLYLLIIWECLRHPEW
jgi:hypothetical protein